MTRNRLSRQRQQRNPKKINRLEWRDIVNPYPPTAVLSVDQLEEIHQASLRVLRDSGMKFLSAQARKLLKSAGASVDETNCLVRFDKDTLAVDAIASIEPGGHFFGSEHTLERYEMYSIRRCCRTGETLKPGKKTVQFPLRNEPIRFGRICLTSISNPPLTGV